MAKSRGRTTEESFAQAPGIAETQKISGLHKKETQRASRDKNTELPVWSRPRPFKRKYPQKHEYWQEYGIHPTEVAKSKKQALEQLRDVRSLDYGR